MDQEKDVKMVRASADSTLGTGVGCNAEFTPLIGPLPLSSFFFIDGTIFIS